MTTSIERKDMNKGHLPLRALCMAASATSLVFALGAGLYRLGLGIPFFAVLTVYHAPLMVSGFLGTLVALERAAALEGRWGYAAPIASGLGGGAIIAGYPLFGMGLAAVGSMGLIATLIVLFRRHFSLHAFFMLLGGAFWLVGNILFLCGVPPFQIAPWWMCFLVLTIAAERLELSRILHLTKMKKVLFSASCAVLSIGLPISFAAYHLGMRLISLGLLLLALWLLAFDVARRAVRMPGLSRFIASSLTAGYIWLFVGGLLGVLHGGVAGGFYSDAFLHAVLLGFVFSMIFAHGPIIFPSLLELGGSFPFSRILYLPLALLHSSLALRITGDLATHPEARLWGGLLNAASIALFFAIIACLSAGARCWTCRSQ